MTHSHPNSFPIYPPGKREPSVENRLKINVPNEALINFCKKNCICKLSFFGSVLTNRFASNSDVDILVEFESGKTPGYFEFSGMEMDLSSLLGRQVDLRTPKELSRYFRNQVMATAQVQYDRV